MRRKRGKMRNSLLLLLIILLLIMPQLIIASNSGSWVEIKRPLNGVYIFDVKVIPIKGQVVLGGVRVEAEASKDIDGVEFIVPPKVGCRGVVIYNASKPPFEFYWDKVESGLKDTGLVAFKARGYANGEYVAEDDIFIWRFIFSHG